MSRRKIKLLSFIFTVCFIASIVVGCSSSDGKHMANNLGANSDNEKKQTDVDQEVPGVKETEGDPYSEYAPIDGKKYNLKWLAPLSQPVEEDGELVQYWEEKFNVDLDIWYIEGTNYAEVLNLKLASGEIPDKFFIQGGLGALYKYKDQGVIMEFPEEVLKKYAPNMYSETEREVPGIFDYGKIEGKMYGIATVNAHALFRSPLVIRGDWLENVGIDNVPETLEEFENAMYRFAKEDPNGSGRNDTYGLSNSALNPIYGAFGYIPEFWEERDGELVYGAVQPEMKDALEILNKWYKDGVLDPEFITGESYGGYWATSNAFVDDRIGVSGLGMFYHWKPASYEGDEEVGTYAEFKKTHSQEQVDALTFIPPPKGPQGKFGTAQGNIIANFNAFGKHLEEEPDKVGKILEILDWANGSSLDNYLTSYYGIEGKHWEKTPDGGNRPIGEYAEGGVFTIGGHTLLSGTTPPSFVFAVNPGREEFAREHELDVGGIQNKLLVDLPSAGKYLTELNKIQEETFIAIITGDKPVDYFDDFITKWRRAGGEQLEIEANDWYATQQNN